MTEFAQSLFQATTDSRVKVTDNHVEFYKAHIDAINVVMSGHVKGDGGETGQTLLKGLEERPAKSTQRPTPRPRNVAVGRGSRYDRAVETTTKG